MEQRASPIRYVSCLGGALDKSEAVFGQPAALGNRELNGLTTFRNNSIYGFQHDGAVQIGLSRSL